MKSLYNYLNYLVTLASRSEVEQFLGEFFVKYRIFDIRFMERTNTKNLDTFAQLELTASKRRQIIESLKVANYVAGPIDDILYKIASLWIFGQHYKSQEIYIKISLGNANSNVICISFHVAEHPMIYPFK
ncbi:hypothetical protein [Dyadobacter sp. CY326]|uniref:hypothetical protein n=1 Tax=Dyadobacter sp. CY326 TaxID=2907300 RepID=UPI001F3CC70E|nr:hypothetical protein [Dyadobacter sp. CY326]MCE7063912.1 hypothetical protein [Dyadobacter sp. CY326]